LLSANGVPEEFVVDVLARIEAGKQIGAAAIRQDLKNLRKSGNEKSAAAGSAVKQIQEDYPIGDTTTGSPIAELAAILARKLSRPDFARVCQILTSHHVLFDPELAEKLDRQFRARELERA
jgi:hypothetical protein